jgi:hypothetical protein
MSDIITGLAFPTVALVLGVALLFLAIVQKVELEKVTSHSAP